MKIMKKVLALVLALAVLSVPMMASAAVGDAVATPSTCIYSGDTVTVAAGETVYFEIGTEQVVGTYDFIVEGTGAFDVAVCTEDAGDGPYLEGTPVSAVDGKVETTITSYESTYCYAAFSITNNSDAEASYVCTIVFPLGSQGNPAAVTLALDATAQVTIAAGAQYYINAALPVVQHDYQLTITGNTGFGLSSGWGMPTPDTDGTITANANAYFGTYNFSLINNTAEEQTYTLAIAEYPIGSEYNPDSLYVGGTVTAELDGNEYYYTATADKTGTLKFAINTETSAADWTYNLTVGYTPYSFSTAWGEADKYITLANVAEGDEITVGVSVPNGEDAYTFAAGTIEFSTYIGTFGDVDADKALSADDLAMIKKGLLGITYVSSYNAGAYDVNNDAAFNVSDIVRAKKRLAGIVTAGDPVAVPSYEYSVYSPADVTVPAGATVYYEISTNGNYDALPFTVNGSGDFSVMVCEEGIYEGYKATSFVAATDGVVSTTIQGYESTYGYACFAITNNTDADAAYNCAITFPVGSEANPAAVTLVVDGTATVTVPAGAQYYIAATLPEVQKDYLLTVTGNTGFGIPSAWGMPTWDTDGTITTTANAYYGTYNFSIINNTTEEQTYTLALANMPIGSESNPDTLEVDKTYTVELDGNEYYYTWTAPYAGTISFTMDNTLCADGWTYKATCGDTVYNFSTGWEESDKNVAAFDVAAGDVVTFGVSIPTYNADYDYYDVYTFAAGTVVFTVDYDIILEEGDPVAVPSYAYCIESGATVTVPAGKTVVYEISTANMYDVLPFTVSGTGDFSVMLCGEDGNGAYVAGSSVAAADGVVSTTIQGFESTYGYVAFAITNNTDADVDYTCTIDFPVGSQPNPAAVTLAVDGTATVTVPAGAQYYIAATLPEMQKDYMLTITGNTGFGLSAGYGMPTLDTDGAITTTANAYWGPYTVSIINNTAEEQTYTLALANMPLGSESNPDTLEVNKTYTLNLEGSSYNYTWTAAEAGTLVFTIDADACASGWTYMAAHNDSAYQFSTAWGEDDKNVLTLEVAAGDVVTYGVSVPTYNADYDYYDAYTPGTGTIVFDVVFTAAE